MNVKKLVVLLLCLAVISGCNSRKSKKEAAVQPEAAKPELSGSFTVSGAYALQPLAAKWADDFMKIHPGVKIEVNETGTGQGINDLMEKKVQLAMISRSLTDDEKNAGVWAIPVAKDGVAPIVNAKNPYLGRIMKQGLSPDEMQKVFTSDKSLTWGELLDTTGSNKAIAYSRADESGAADMFAHFFFKTSADLRGIKVTGDYEMIKSIQQNPYAIGFCNFSFAFDAASGERRENIQIVPFDLDYDNKIDKIEVPFKNIEVAHRSIWLGIYPENLCRELSIGSMGEPVDPVIVEFLKYILTDGQESVKEKGLCNLNDVYIRFGLERLQ
jgi:phosphate transport system substrate-binding protein